MAQGRVKFKKSGEFLPNLVTLCVTKESQKETFFFLISFYKSWKTF